MTAYVTGGGPYAAQGSCSSASNYNNQQQQQQHQQQQQRPTTIVFPSLRPSGSVFAHLKEFKHWNKSGLRVGEKCAFWIYEKVSSWSKRWFTHTFLCFVLFVYSLLGAWLFVSIEGKYESNIQDEIKRERDEMIRRIRDLWDERGLGEDAEDEWNSRVRGQILLYEERLYGMLKKLNFQTHPEDMNWVFWNGVIYCCTIYTTIVLTEEDAGDVEMDKDEEEEQRRLRMERMVEDTERMEERTEERNAPQPAKVRAMSPAVRRSTEQKSELEVKEKLPRRSASPLRVPEPGNGNGNNKRPSDRENVELRRRMGSPDTARISTARHLSPTSASSDPYDEVELSDSRSGGSVRRRTSSRHRYSDDEELDEPRAVQHRRSPMRKQIIPISDNRLMEDVSRAKRAYSHRERSYEYEYEDEDEDYVPRRGRQREVAASALRRRKPSVLHTDQEKEDIGKNLSTQKSSSWWSWIPFFGSRKQKVEDLIEESKKKDEKLSPPVEKSKQIERVTANEPEKVTIRDFFRSLVFVTAEFRAFCQQNPREVAILVELRNLCIIETIVTLILCGLGGFAFRFTEGAFESFYKCGVKRVKRDFLDSLWNFSHNMKEDDWKSLARSKLKAFEEQLHAANEAGVSSYSGMKNWSFLNSVVYSLTVVTTIGYGHISPSTSTGRALTIVYAIFGIPMFLIVLADFGKLFTRGIKFLWAFVRRLYYTGSCRKVRRTVHMQEMMKGVQLVYDWSTSFRRPSQMTDEEIVEMQRQQQQQQQQQQQHHTSLSVDGNTPQQTPESPSTPAMSTFEIDDEFNLPISVAITILVLYIIIGAVIFNIFEDWTFFESFYFVFISMSTIGFGDFVPQDPLYMMLSIVYLIFGLALTSMCINVVQVKLADQFKQASQKIGLAIGVHVAEEEGALKPVPPERVEIAEVHGAMTKERIAPRAKPEEADL